MKIVLGENRYGKAENRVVRVTRINETHNLLDLNVSVQLSGDFSDTHLTGSNKKVIPTDTQKNTVFAFAQKYPAMEPEVFGLTLAKHFLDSQAHVQRAEVRLEQFFWDRIMVDGKPHPRAFAKNSSMKRVARVVVDRAPNNSKIAFLSSGLEDLVLLKTSDSEFTDFIRDQYTTLPDATDRIMATQVSAKWRHGSHEIDELEKIDFGKSFSQASSKMLSAFAERYSLSLQQTLFEMGSAVIKEQPTIAAIKLSLPNKHHFLVDLSPFGQENNGEVFIAADRPYGLIEAVIERDDAPSSGYTWPTW